MFKYPPAEVAECLVMKKLTRDAAVVLGKKQVSESESEFLRALLLFDVFVLLFGLALWQQAAQTRKPAFKRTCWQSRALLKSP